MSLDFNDIQKRKPIYKIKAPLKEHLKQYSRYAELPVSYDDLCQYTDLVSITDDSGVPTLWYAVLYERDLLEELQEKLTTVYEILVADGDDIPYLSISSIEFCSFGNSKPFRIKVKNEINDNHDYFYIKKADASRVYGLELEEIFSPDKVSFVVSGNTMVVEHIVGIPCDEFVLKNENVKIENRLRFAKEFVKFNERCFSRLLGDMRAYNFIIEITQDFDNVQYRLRPIDFDQQNYEGRKSIYLPQYYKDNIALVELAQELCNKETAAQYKREEHVAMRKRFLAAKQRTRSLIRKMKKDIVSSKAHIEVLRSDLHLHHNEPKFLEVTTMAEILTLHLEAQLGIKIFN